MKILIVLVDSDNGCDSPDCCGCSGSSVSRAFVVGDEDTEASLAKEWRHSTFLPRTWKNKHGSGVIEHAVQTISMIDWVRFVKRFTEVPFIEMFAKSE